MSVAFFGDGDSYSSPAVATRNNRRAPNEAVAATDAVTPASMTPLLSSIDRINAALEAALAQPPPPTGTVRVCHATEDEWNAFADSEDQIVRLNYLEWFADTEEIHIIEFADAPHEDYISAFEKVTSFGELHVYRWLKGHLAAKNSQGPHWCPDLSYGPREDTPHSVLPPNIPIFADFRTIKVEIGVSQQWGMAPGELDHKAIAIWAVMPVEYVLCVKFEPDFTNAEYKLYDARVNPLVQLAPLPIVAPRTVIQLDGRRILGIPPGMALPVGFPATLLVDLYSPLVWARR
ncbi:hypothetical protein PHYSODRAFT_483773 [Phytophthora sojae]|uniref:Restriction endonuclease domain-containing protein n=1 Tax=Phytophthora sojae (strain P6497) TaxID=1094619 RepID=G4YSQ2_PHYSP|nr:hypothetical protein PHYSODRAFT_483773 [Phytophthora sojae]EGZ24174.1 hypothetical protein PHYSODRAFT_483773 [Phytophthora sojae]|eukprot:XP_009519462.1 hypothetical protein PHYSODRAFT_483773 [Phytophthora sojae]